MHKLSDDAAPLALKVTAVECTLMAEHLSAVHEQGNLHFVQWCIPSFSPVTFLFVSSSNPYFI